MSARPGEGPVRQAIVDACREMVALGLTQGTSGNIGVRHGAGLLITPSALAYDRMSPADIAFMPLDGAGAWQGPRKPSSEWRFHRDILAARPEIGAVVHAHPPHATALAILGRDIPACHYMIAAFGGPTIRCAPYAIYGSEELSARALAALEGRQGCLLASHGMIALGATLAEAIWRAVELETLARQYHLACQIGEPAILPDAEIAAVAERMAGGYGVWGPAADGGDA